MIIRILVVEFTLDVYFSYHGSFKGSCKYTQRIHSSFYVLPNQPFLLRTILTLKPTACGVMSPFPAKIIRMIWELLIDEPCLLPIQRNGEHHCLDGTQGWQVFTPQLILLSVCRDSRALALKRYTLLFNSPCKSNKNLYLNRERDVVFLVTTDLHSINLDRSISDDVDLWDIHWDIPGMMKLNVEILCKHG